MSTVLSTGDVGVGGVQVCLSSEVGVVPVENSLTPLLHRTPLPFHRDPVGSSLSSSHLKLWGTSSEEGRRRNTLPPVLIKRKGVDTLPRLS